MSANPERKQRRDEKQQQENDDEELPDRPAFRRTETAARARLNVRQHYPLIHVL